MTDTITSDKTGADEAGNRNPPGADTGKYHQILEGARQVFLNLGFDGTSMGDIARAAGVSKGTLYVYFDNKATLFSALIADERERAKHDWTLNPDNPDIGAELRRYGRRYLGHITSPRTIQSVRTVVGIAEKFPEVGRDFYRDGPKRGRDYIAAYLGAHVEAGRLTIDDCTAAARQLQALMQSGLVNELLYGVRDTPTEAEIGGIIDDAVATFLARYAVRTPPAR